MASVAILAVAISTLWRGSIQVDGKLRYWTGVVKKEDQGPVSRRTMGRAQLTTRLSL